MRQSANDRRGATNFADGVCKMLPEAIDVGRLINGAVLTDLRIVPIKVVSDENRFYVDKMFCDGVAIRH
jgi:hypothetical protein